MEYVNKSPRIGMLSTADKTGNVDSGVFGSPHMTDERTVVMELGKNRTLANLQQNPHAVYLIMVPGDTITDWKGIRVYLKVLSIATSGPVLNIFKTQMAQGVGEEAVKMIYAAVNFEVIEVRPLIDMGQGWEQSVEDSSSPFTRLIHGDSTTPAIRSVNRTGSFSGKKVIFMCSFDNEHGSREPEPGYPIENYF